MRTKVGLKWVLLLLFSLAGTRSLAAQGLEPSQEEKRVVVKRYADLSAADAYEAARSNVRAAVRFSDSYDGRAGIPERFRMVRGPAGVRPVVAAFRTQVGLTCLVAADDEETLQKAPRLRAGQSITVEGTIMGAAGLHRCVLVDRLLTGSERRSVITYELVVRWPGEKPKKMLQPGVYSVEFPCHYVEGEKENVKFEIVKRNREAFLKKIEEEAQKGQKKVTRVYGSYSPAQVYQYALRNRQIDVSFRDKFQKAAPPSPSLRVLRVYRRGEFLIGYAFSTEGGLTCLVPANQQALVDKARAVVPGQTVEVKGTVAGRRSIYRCVLVDELKLPNAEAYGGKLEAPDIWEIKLYWPEQKPKMLYKPGLYPLEMPCQHKEGAIERMVLELREVRVVKGRKKQEPEGKAAAPGAGETQ